jgi:hypothetical protein
MSASNGGDDVVGICFADEGVWFLVMLVDKVLLEA